MGHSSTEMRGIESRKIKSSEIKVEADQCLVWTLKASVPVPSNRGGRRTRTCARASVLCTSRGVKADSDHYATLRSTTQHYEKPRYPTLPHQNLLWPSIYALLPPLAVSSYVNALYLTLSYHHRSCTSEYEQIHRFATIIIPLKHTFTLYLLPSTPLSRLVVC